MSARLKKMYDDKVAPALKEQFKYANPHQVPRVTKIVANMGLGEAVQNPKIIEVAQKGVDSDYGSENRGYSSEEVYRDVSIT